MKPIDMLYTAAGMDTVAAAVSEKRCIKAPAGCGKNLLNEDGSPRFVFDEKDQAQSYEAEWRISGMCPECWDKMAAEAERMEAEEECCGNAPCTCQHASFPAF